MHLRSDTFEQRLRDLGAEWVELESGRVVSSFDDPDAGYWAVREGDVGLADRSERQTLAVAGEDAVEWLQGLVTNDLVDLVELGSGQWNFATDVNGRIVSDMRVLHLPDLLLLDLEPGTIESGLVDHLRQNIILEDVELDVRTGRTGRIGLYGASASDVIDAEATLEESAGALAPFDGTWGRLGGVGIVVRREPMTGEPGYELYFERSKSAEVWGRLEGSSAARIEPIGQRTVETLRIEAGTPRFGVELDDEIIPLEAGLRPFISFDKGCYVGQEIIARLDARGEPAKRLRTLVFEGGAAPGEGAEVRADDREVGEVRSSVWSPALRAPVALAYVGRRHHDFGTTVRVEGREATVRPLGHPLDQGRTER
ncbi:MAG: folate-binding protein YgfZ [Bradymonadaceae bacterium]